MGSHDPKLGISRGGGGIEWFEASCRKYGKLCGRICMCVYVWVFTVTDRQKLHVDVQRCLLWLVVVVVVLPLILIITSFFSHTSSRNSHFVVVFNKVLTWPVYCKNLFSLFLLFCCCWVGLAIWSLVLIKNPFTVSWINALRFNLLALFLLMIFFFFGFHFGF